MLLVPLLLVAGIGCLRHTKYQPNRKTIWKKPLDTREYYGLELSNQLRVLLVSDPMANKASVALGVAVGGQDDPADTPGLSHLVEHMMYQGDEWNRYDFQEFLDGNGGINNALTESDRTIYHYYINPHALHESLDMFAELFIKPNFGKDEVLGEAHVIEGEYRSCMPFSDDSFKHTRFVAVNASHPLAKFGCGNYKTLVAEPTRRGTDLRRLVYSHHRHHYSSNIMSLVVIGQENLDTLKGMVIPRFSNIQNKKILLSKHGSPFGRKNLATRVQINPNSEHGEIRIDFVLTPTKNGFYAGLEFLHYLFNRYSEECLLRILRSEGLANQAKLTNEENHRGFSLFSFSFEPTSDGFKRKDEIMYVLFAYIDAIIIQGITRERYLEYLATQSDGYEYPDDYAVALATILTIGVEFSHALKSYDGGFDATSINAVAAQFQIANLIQYEINQFHGQATTEPWFGMNYSATKFSDFFLKKLNLVSAESYGIKLPQIQTEVQAEEEVEIEANLLAKNSIGYAKLVHLQPVEPSWFELELDLGCNPTPNLTVYMLLLKEVMMEIYLKVMKKFPLVKANTTFTIQGTSIIFVLESQHSTQDVVCMFAKHLKNYQATKKALDFAKQMISLESKDDDPEAFLSRAIDPYFMEDGAVEETITRTTLPLFREFIKWIFDSLKFNILCSDSSMLDKLGDIKTELEYTFGINPNTVKYLPVKPTAHHSSKVLLEQVSRQDSSTMFYLHMYDTGRMEDYTLTVLASIFFKSRFSYFMLTKKRLGYHASSQVWDNPGGGGILGRITTTKSTLYIDKCLQEFLPTFLSEMRLIPEHKLHQMITYQYRKLQNSLATMQLNDKSWSGIKTFLKDQETIKHALTCLPNLTHLKFIKFVESRLMENSPDRFTFTLHEVPAKF